MTDLRTHAEYQAIAQDLNLPCNAYIDGKQALRAHDQYTELKTIWIDLSDRDQADLVE
jgi:hypothetical protein